MFGTNQAAQFIPENILCIIYFDGPTNATPVCLILYTLFIELFFDSLPLRSPSTLQRPFLSPLRLLSFFYSPFLLSCLIISFLYLSIYLNISVSFYLSKSLPFYPYFYPSITSLCNPLSPLANSSFSAMFHRIWRFQASCWATKCLNFYLNASSARGSRHLDKLQHF